MSLTVVTPIEPHVQGGDWDQTFEVRLNGAALDISDAAVKITLGVRAPGASTSLFLTTDSATEIIKTATTGQFRAVRSIAEAAVFFPQAGVQYDVSVIVEDSRTTPNPMKRWYARTKMAVLPNLTL